MTMPTNEALALRDAAYETGVVDERMGRAAVPDDRDPGYTDTYSLDFNGYVVVSRPFTRVRADEVVSGDLLILDSGLSRVTHVTPCRLDNGVTVVHITGPTNIVRADYEIVTVLR